MKSARTRSITSKIVLVKSAKCLPGVMWRKWKKKTSLSTDEQHASPTSASEDTYVNEAVNPNNLVREVLSSLPVAGGDAEEWRRPTAHRVWNGGQVQTDSEEKANSFDTARRPLTRWTDIGNNSVASAQSAIPSLVQYDSRDNLSAGLDETANSSGARSQCTCSL